MTALHFLSGADAFAIEEDADSLSAKSAAEVSQAAGSLLLRRLGKLPEQFTPRDVQWGRWSGLDSPTLVGKALSYLLQRGEIALQGSRHGMPIYCRASDALRAGSSCSDSVTAATDGPTAEQPSGAPSVYFEPGRNKWRARGWKNGRRVTLGRFDTRAAAELAACMPR